MKVFNLIYFSINIASRIIKMEKLNIISSSMHQPLRSQGILYHLHGIILGPDDSGPIDAGVIETNGRGLIVPMQVPGGGGAET